MNIEDRIQDHAYKLMMLYEECTSEDQFEKKTGMNLSEAFNYEPNTRKIKWLFMAVELLKNDVRQKRNEGYH